ncbi:MAG: hypothetical protein JEZ05_04210 [Tenericutes bacterium]|nr:hypothetical protein [Mycoplasmatota bacterium]
MENKALKWYKLDNSAKIYPILISDRYTYVFRLSAILTEVVDPEILYQAITESRNRFPSFFVTLKRGFFWYYFEENLQDPVLEKETNYACEKIHEHRNRKYQFRFLYYNKRISLEINHVLTDGGGALVFLNAIIYRYLELIGKDVFPDESVILLDSEIDPAEQEDSFIKNYSGGPLNPPKLPKAYFNKRKLFKKFGSGVINSFIDSAELKALAYKSSASITQYIVALLTYATIKTGNKKLLDKYPVNVCVPVNLRGKYGSKTLSNFSLFFHTSYKSLPNLDFESILTKVKQDFKEEYSEEKIQSKLDTVCVVQEKMLFKLIPLFVKYFFLKIGYNTFGRRPTSITISNFGLIKTPKAMEPFIESFSFYMGSAVKTAVAVNSYKGKTSIVFSRACVNTNLEEAFFSFLTEQGLQVEIVSNFWELHEKKYKKLRKG